MNPTFCPIDYALNARPLTPVSANSSELGTITPNFFLPDNQVTRITSIVGVDEFDHRKWYAHAQSYVNENWECLLKQYVPALNRRSKWQKPSEQHLKFGDLVWILEESKLKKFLLGF